MRRVRDDPQPMSWLKPSTSKATYLAGGGFPAEAYSQSP